GQSLTACIAARSLAAARFPPRHQGEHFLLHNVGAGTDAAGKQLRMLKYRGPQFGVTILLADVANGGLHMPPAYAVLPLEAGTRQNIVCPAGTRYQHGGGHLLHIPPHRTGGTSLPVYGGVIGVSTRARLGV